MERTVRQSRGSSQVSTKSYSFEVKVQGIMESATRMPESAGDEK